MHAKNHLSCLLNFMLSKCYLSFKSAFYTFFSVIYTLKMSALLKLENSHLPWRFSWFWAFLSFIFQVCCTQNAMKANTYNMGMYLSGERTEIAQMADRSSSNWKVSSSIPVSVEFSPCLFKSCSTFYSNFSVITHFKLISVIS